ncbi:MAG: hypothetical protein ACI8UR_000809 [Natronomonas sp.]
MRGEAKLEWIMRVKRSLQMVHRHPEQCDPDIPLPFGEWTEVSRNRLEKLVENGDLGLEPCEVCFPELG